MKLIINADDFGRTRGINYGIVECMKKGILTSTTIMMTMPYAEHAIELAKKEGIKSIGVHLTFIEKSLSQGKTLVDENGDFKKYPELMAEADVEEIKKEMRMQIDKLISFGIKPTHLDGHHHAHLYSSKMVEAVFEMAREYKLPVRVGNVRATRLGEEIILPDDIRTTNIFEGNYYGERVNLTDFVEILDLLGDQEVVELMCHPAFLCSDTLRSTYAYPRLIELDILTGDGAKEYIRDKGIELADFTVL
ncbi:MAG: chitin disaccharide deacetylase [Sebaldella sp.]|nr:chitin disaccharide deacetylase [Sebaldella sp.]